MAGGFEIFGPAFSLTEFIDTFAVIDAFFLGWSKGRYDSRSSDYPFQPNERDSTHIFIERFVLTSSRTWMSASGASLFFKCENFPRILARSKARGRHKCLFFARTRSTARRGVAHGIRRENHGSWRVRGRRKLRRYFRAQSSCPSNSAKVTIRTVESYRSARVCVFCEPNGKEGARKPYAARM